MDTTHTVTCPTHGHLRVWVSADGEQFSFGGDDERWFRVPSTLEDYRVTHGGCCYRAAAEYLIAEEH